MSVNSSSLPLSLNIGCGTRKLDGWINIDIDGEPDLCIDVREGLPFEDASVGLIFNEHFIEHISQLQGIEFLRECRRTLIPGGTLRIATPDLDGIVEDYCSEDNWLGPDWIEFGYPWVQNRCEMLNLALREWGHSWLYNEEELRRIAELAGLIFVARVELGESPNPALRNLEYRDGSRLILEFMKPDRRLESEPLVSLIIPGYKPDFFAESLKSALAQSYEPLEILVVDDSGSRALEKIVTELAGSDPRVRYHANSKNLGSRDSHIVAFGLARGEYFKVLNDDDLLRADCVSRMAACLKAYPDVTLVASHRRLIDDAGRELPEQIINRRPVVRDSWLNGTDLISAVLGSGVNFLGEPSTVMFRAEDITNIHPDPYSFAGVQYFANGDQVMWMNLLSRGNAIYLVESLSSLRLHPGQEQHQPGYRARGIKAHSDHRAAALRLGLLDAENHHRVIPARPLEDLPWWPTEAISAARRGALLDSSDPAASRKEWLEVANLTNEPLPRWKAAAAARRCGDSDIASSELAEIGAQHPWYYPMIAEQSAVIADSGDPSGAMSRLVVANSMLPFMDVVSGITGAGKHLKQESRFLLRALPLTMSLHIQLVSDLPSALHPLQVQIRMADMEHRVLVEQPGEPINVGFTLDPLEEDLEVRLAWREFRDVFDDAKCDPSKAGLAVVAIRYEPAAS